MAAARVRARNRKPAAQKGETTGTGASNSGSGTASNGTPCAVCDPNDEHWLYRSPAGGCVGVRARLAGGVGEGGGERCNDHMGFLHTCQVAQ